LQRPAGEKHGLHGPPPQPTQPVIAPSETSVRGQEEAGPERACSEQLEELAAGRPPGQFPGSVRRDVHRYEKVMPAVIILCWSSVTLSTANSGST
jgi:hypothetical protein